MEGVAHLGGLLFIFIVVFLLAGIIDWLAGFAFTLAWLARVFVIRLVLLFTIHIRLPHD